MTQVNTDYPGATPADVPFNAANFTSSAGSWTVEAADVATNQLISFGNNVFLWIFRINTTTVVSTPTKLSIALPFGKVAAKTCYQPVLLNPTSLPTEGGIAEIIAGTSVVNLQRYNADWVAGTNLTYVSGAIFFTTA